MRQQAARRLANLQLAQAMAPIVKGDDAVEARADVFHIGDLGEECGELEYAAAEGFDARQGFGLFAEEIREMVADHRGAGAGWDHDILAGFERLEEMARDGTGFFAIAAIVSGLAAAGLVFGKIHCIAETFEHFHHSHSGIGK